jgi:hypothetical protein
MLKFNGWYNAFLLKNFEIPELAKLNNPPSFKFRTLSILKNINICDSTGTVPVKQNTNSFTLARAKNRRKTRYRIL